MFQVCSIYSLVEGGRRKFSSPIALACSPKRNLALCLIAILAGTSIWNTPAQAQQLPNIVLPLETKLQPGSVDPGNSNKQKPKVDSALSALEGSFLNLTPEQQADAETGAGMPINNGKVTVEVIVSGSASALLRELNQLGMEGGTVFGKMISGKLPISAISQASNLQGLSFMRLSQSITRKGSVDNQADSAMQSDLGRASFSVLGSGVTIGILSDSYNQRGGEASDITSGDLPDNVLILDDTAAGINSDEGRAMAQLIHDVAPGANLMFHTAFGGAADFAQGILDLAEAGADVIVDDVGILNQPMFQDGIVAQAVDQVVSNGVAYYSAAGNSANQSYESAYVDSGVSFPAALFTLTNLHDFDNAGDVTQEIMLPAGGRIFLSVQWDQPFASSGGSGSLSDLDAYFLDATGAMIASSVDSNSGGDAVEILSYTNTSSSDTTISFIVGVHSGPIPSRIKWIDFAGDLTALNHPTFSSTSFGHPNSNGAIAVGASRYDNTPPFGVDPPIPEPFTSHGGLEILFDTAGNAITPQDRNKPELVAPDGVDNTFFGGSDFEGNSFPNFFGTSAAAPNVAAVAALQLECNSSLTPAQILTIQTNSAIDMGSPGFDNITGAGLIDALASLNASCLPPTTCNGLPVTVFIANGDTPTSQSDVILGTQGADTIVAMGGDDTICALGGLDTINGGRGSDWIDAGAGDDNVLGAADNDTIFGGTGNDLLQGGPANDTIFGGEDDDTIFGNSGSDSIDGGPGVDAINGGSGADTITTGTGSTVGSGKTVNGGSGNDTITGGPDDDEIRGSTDDDMIKGGGGNDRLFGGGGEDFIEGEDGNDFIRGNAASDTIDGGSDQDDIDGGTGKDLIFGGADNDTLKGSTGNDEVHGDDGQDTINGGGGNDNLFGEAGNDIISGGGSNDNMDGGAGSNDICDGQGGVDTQVNCETVTDVP